MEQAKFYTILQNPEGDICILLKPLNRYEGEVSNPEIIYDGADNAILYRNKEGVILLDYIPKDWQAKIFQKDSILVVEYDLAKNEVVNEYFVKIIKVKNLLDLGEDFVNRETLNAELKNLGLL